MKTDMSQPLLLVVDDETGVRQSLQLVFNKSYNVLEACSADEAIEKTASEKPDVILLDIMMPGTDGLAVLKQIKSVHPDGQVIMLTGLNTARTAFVAKGTGAFDYVTKPFDVEELRLRVEHALEKIQLSRELERLKEEVGRKYGVEQIIGRSKQIVDVFKAVSMVAAKKSTVLITGESGTGKELIARAIHYNSDRRAKPFVVVNCAALPDTLIESELFGYERGAFTNASQKKIGRFELAHGGTLFLDEIGEMPATLQVKLLRVLQEGEVRRLGDTKNRAVDVRLVSATNKDFDEEIRTGTFRSDLYYRIAVVPIHLVPLRQRREEVPALVRHFLDQCKRKLKVDVDTLDADAMKLMLEYPWPGNVRELENTIERAVVLADSSTIGPDDLPPHVRTPVGVMDSPDLDEDELSVKKHGAALEKRLIRRALERTGGNRTRAAELLELSSRALLYKIREYELE
jgi:DNA-binding NtrC family response regulator